eukprot:TRINITY_DN3689_c0_g1_i1.p1 TRINITY_DN3689_c0_g1~~TRINITY_DN3689_c0_g1_i1.p1  ORF type:complete len:607 (-),score=121.31 TRINITY_DN3689_c0_g1_i1:64-1884(-)
MSKIPTFSIPCTFHNKKSILYLDCQRDRPTNEISIQIFNKKENLKKEIMIMDIGYIVVKYRKKKLKLYRVGDHGDGFGIGHDTAYHTATISPKILKKKLKGSKDKMYYFDSSDSDSGESSDDEVKIGKTKKIKIKFETTSATYLAGYLINFLRRLVKPEDHDVTDNDISLFIGTWNVGNTRPDHNNLSPWIPTNMHDIYVISGQEVDYEPGDRYETCSEDWSIALARHMGPGYICLSSVSMWQIRMQVFVRVELFDKISAVDRSEEPTGIGNIMGNKGGVCVSFKFNETTFCFVNSHLAAHQEKVKARNEDVKEIIDSITLTDHVTDISTQYHHVFWCGDLNYRIKKTREEVIECVSKGIITALLPFDQLNIERENNRVFCNFQEGPIKFIPTYKFDNHQPHDYYSEERNRVPAWCDRILWSSWDSLVEDVTQTEYNATYDIITSDHVPVYATFQVRTELPVVPRVVSPQQCVIKLENLRARDILSTDADGLSDPYLKVYAEFIENKGKTEILHGTLSPVWDANMKLFPFFSDIEFLEKKCLVFHLKDKDHVGSDSVGRGTLSLGGKTDGDSYEFKIQMRKHGLPSGIVKGTIKVEWISQLESTSV